MRQGLPEEVDQFAGFDGVPEFDHKYYFDMSSCLRYGQVIRIRSYEKANTFLTSKSYALADVGTRTPTFTFKFTTRKICSLQLAVT